MAAICAPGTAANDCALRENQAFFDLEIGCGVARQQAQDFATPGMFFHHIMV
jgi:hypothetical protein